MKIAFLTNCLESGRDGVGDYTALLAAECERRSHATARLALNDPFAKIDSASANELRLASSQRWPDRVEKARDFLAAFAPDFVSLQFVCYGFHPRGIDFLLASRLCKIIGARPLHLMLHELWIGAEIGAPLKQQLLGALQHRALLGLIRTTSPRVIHTSNSAYVHLLGERGITATRLPLFGSIPVLSAQAAPRTSDGEISFAMFGTLHPAWPPEPLFMHLRGLRKKITFTHFGRIGPGEELWKKLAAEHGNDLQFRALGEQSPEKIAALFSQTDFGIATTPWSLIGKSATVAAMLDHGIPVIVNRDDVRYKGMRDEPAPPLLIKMDDRLPEKILAAKRLPPQPALPRVAAAFLQALENAS
jgi:hypothetical protein